MPSLRRKASIVIPLYNESAVFRSLAEALRQAIERELSYDWEVVFADDGSSDGTANKVVEHYGLLGVPVRLVRLSRNFGHQAALIAGIAAATGDAIICMDADLQDPPQLISDFLRKYEEGYNVVYAVRSKRAAPLPKRLAYQVFYRIFSRVAEIPIPLDSGDFGLIDRRVASLIVAMPEKDIFLRGLRSWVGFSQIGIGYTRPERAIGSTKYTFAKLLKLAASAFFGFSLLPLRIATSLGFCAVLISCAYAVFALVVAVFYHSAPRGWASVIGVVSFIGGAQLVSIGILGEYIGRIYRQAQARPLYIVAEQRELTPDLGQVSRSD